MSSKTAAPNNPELEIAAVTRDQASQKMAALSVMSLGLIIVLFTLFSPMAKVHNATHDTRHAVVAPCH